MNLSNHFLNVPHPSGKLARWRLILQDMDLKTKYKHGRKAIMLMQSQIPHGFTNHARCFSELSRMVATLDLNDEVESKDGESTLHDQ